MVAIRNIAKWVTTEQTPVYRDGNFLGMEVLHRYWEYEGQEKEPDAEPLKEVWYSVPARIFFGYHCAVL